MIFKLVFEFVWGNRDEGKQKAGVKLFGLSELCEGLDSAAVLMTFGMGEGGSNCLGDTNLMCTYHR